MRLAIIASFVLGLAACGGGDPTPKEACNDLAATTCSRLYECFTAPELAAAQYPPTEAGCVTRLEANAGCDAQTVANTCQGNETYHGSSVDDCVSQINGLDCAMIRDPNFNTSTAAPACDKVCSI